MQSISLQDVIQAFFVFGWMEENARPEFRSKLEKFGAGLHFFQLEGFGAYFYTLPRYSDYAENDDLVLITLGFFHDGNHLLSAREILNNRWVSEQGIKYENIQGDGALVLFSKHEATCFVFRTFLSASVLHYFEQPGLLIVSDNLRLASSLQHKPELDEEALPQHFIYRHIYGRDTYIKGISRLMVGEMISWHPSRLNVEIKQDFKQQIDRGAQKPVIQETIDWYFEGFKHIVGVYLEEHAQNAATMLSGGIDSSYIQAAVNAVLSREERFPSFSYIIDSPGFAYEIDYAQEAARALNTAHTFIELTPQQYAQGIVQATEIVGEPMLDDVRSCFYLLVDHLWRNYPGVKYLLHGGYADGFHGGTRAFRMIQGDKYRSWPIPLLDILGTALAPFSQSKSYGAKTAAEVLRSIRDPHSRQYFLNSVSVYTDWEMVQKCFPETVVQEAFTRKTGIEPEYLDSQIIVEKVYTQGTLTTGIRQRAMERTMGNYRNLAYVFPFADLSVVKAIYSFNPMERYLVNGRTKMILKSTLEGQYPGLTTEKPKGWSGYGRDELFDSMRVGELSEMVRAIERPGFISPADFQKKISQPDWFTWNMLTLDIFKKLVFTLD